MGVITDAFDLAFRDYVTPGFPASGLNDPDKAEARAIGPLIEAAVPVTDKAAGAAVDGVTPDNTVFQDLVDAGPGEIRMVRGERLLTTTITVEDSTALVGEVMGATTVLFEPTTDRSCFKLDNGSEVFRARIENLGFRSTNTSHAKTAIEIVDGADTVLENINIAQGDWPGASDIGIHTRGRQSLRATGIVMAGVARPLVIDNDPNYATLTCDAYLFTLLQLHSNVSTAKIVEIPDGAAVTNLTFNGLFVQGGKYGVYYVDSSAGIASYMFTARGFRSEQALDATGWSWYGDRTGGNPQQDLKLEDAYFEGGRNGLYLRNHLNIVLDKCTFATLAGKTTMDIEGVPGTMLWIRGCRFGDGTITLTHLRKLIGTQPMFVDANAGDWEVWIYDEGSVSNQLPLHYDGVREWTHKEVGVPHTGGAPQIRTTPILAPPNGALIQISWSSGGGLVHFATDGTTTILSGTTDLNTSGAGTCVQVTDLGGAAFGYVNKLASDADFLLRAIY